MRIWIVTICTWLFIAGGSFLLVLGGLDLWESRHAQTEVSEQWQQDSANRSGETQQNEQWSGVVARVAPPPTGSPVARLTIPRLGATLYVVEGADNQDLKRGPGHLRGTVLPGEDGNCVIAGHRDTHFRILKDIQKGDEIVLSREGREFHYKVDGTKIVLPSNNKDLRPADSPVLNLVTCYPFYYMGSAPKRFIVHAQLATCPPATCPLEAAAR